jgi:hypothetical protein
MKQPPAGNCRNHSDQDGMGEPAVPYQPTDFVKERVRDHVQVGERANNRSPNHALVADPATEHGLTDRRAQCRLGQ